MKYKIFHLIQGIKVKIELIEHFSCILRILKISLLCKKAGWGHLQNPEKLKDCIKHQYWVKYKILDLIQVMTVKIELFEQFSSILRIWKILLFCKKAGWGHLRKHGNLKDCIKHKYWLKYKILDLIQVIKVKIELFELCF